MALNNKHRQIFNYTRTTIVKTSKFLDKLSK